MGELIIAVLGVLSTIATNAYFYGKLTQRVKQLEDFQLKVERHLGWDGSK